MSSWPQRSVRLAATRASFGCGLELLTLAFCPPLAAHSQVEKNSRDRSGVPPCFSSPLPPPPFTACLQPPHLLFFYPHTCVAWSLCSTSALSGPLPETFFLPVFTELASHRPFLKIDLLKQPFLAALKQPPLSFHLLALCYFSPLRLSRPDIFHTFIC